MVYRWGNQLWMMEFPLPCLIERASWIVTALRILSGRSARVISDSNWLKIRHLIPFWAQFFLFLWVKHRETVHCNWQILAIVQITGVLFQTLPAGKCWFYHPNDGTAALGLAYFVCPIPSALDDDPGIPKPWGSFPAGLARFSRPDMVWGWFVGCPNQLCQEKVGGKKSPKLMAWKIGFATFCSTVWRSELYQQCQPRSLEFVREASWDHTSSHIRKAYRITVSRTRRQNTRGLKTNPQASTIITRI